MSDFELMPGFEDVWRPPIRQRAVRPASGAASKPSSRARLARLAAKAPEVMVKVTGRTKDHAHLSAHLSYISRNGRLELEGGDSLVLSGRHDLADLADEWSDVARANLGQRRNAPLSHSVILSMPEGTSEVGVRDAARAFAAELFAGRHDYVFTLHTDTPRPHVHLAICSRGYAGQRLNPKKGDLELWRQTFARALRDRGIEAEATPRRARGVTRKAERAPIRRLRDRFEAGRGSIGRVRRSAYVDAAKAAAQGPGDARPWETKLLARQRHIRALYLRQARLLGTSADPEDQRLAAKVIAFVAAMPAPETERQALARELRAVDARRARDPADAGGRERSR